jgi:hypothetical protein
MTRHWTLSHSGTASLLSLLLIVGCADRADNTQKLEEEKAAATATGPAADVPSQPNVPDTPVDRPAPASPRKDDSTGARATAGRRDTEPRRPASGARSVTPDHVGEESRAAESRTPTRRAAEYREVTIPEGAALPLELMTPLSSETAQVETPVRARLRQSIMVNGVTALPAGAVLSGEVTDVERAGRVKGRARLVFTFNEVDLNGVREDLKTNPIAFEAEATKGEDATKIGAGAVGGAIVGGIIGGKEGAGKGAAIGGAAGTGVVLATRGKEVKLANGANIAASLAEPLKIRVPAR